ncbi:MAG: magnesium protoporphyrin IX methyltransferase [Pseudotabrizicola sp.]|uniref:magnesium protoporphyrin IX methyltransferase n=1 Tax=Pseudotabrizicola sp. TaxID=2939647 RepID=UPI00271C55FB|nr:magnesium protoporphyrin IX methyltransferase [Pseudotabrizicola sp.]MDO8882380.1 magnesium protoporphyrin IX methyltransferase [Pseudotabrizicola sp.]MDP2081500.1 magnesium protoporphyrin IX methyltransferase [Pseudotabrizicola sp.]MDZ7573013.1 magnesium protoporphyrin IX methyltransferase [Pseudotabrizicola sp.]
MTDYSTTRARVEDYFDRSATKVWERLCSDAPVSRIRQTVRMGRDAMRAMMLAQLPADLSGARILDAGCGTGLMTAELAQRGAEVVAVDIAPQLIGIAQEKLDPRFRGQVTFASGDMTDASFGSFDHVIAMDSLIYYNGADITGILHRLGARTRGSIVFTVAPRTPFLMAFFTAGKLFPRADRSPIMIPHAFDTLAQTAGPGLGRVGRVAQGFYISECLEYRP